MTDLPYGDGEELDGEFEDDFDDEEGAAPDFTDADAFFAAEVSPVEPAVLVLYDRTYTLPTRVPLAFTMLSERHAADEDLASIRTVLAPVFGADALDHWLERGMNDRQFAIILIWATQNMHSPRSCTLAQAADRYDQQQARGKAVAPLNRAARRSGSGGRSSPGGRSSKRI
ncbi:hypothetical protein [Kitasatospora fiedleri]|uniref:hypothetical protein n=1 Tax=Kitasatospora fiedleri TaxID=2991545 RepID=UPI00249C99B0|nr:hypothetical protein [Kitasatospora fiedleri]